MSIKQRLNNVRARLKRVFIDESFEDPNMEAIILAPMPGSEKYLEDKSKLRKGVSEPCLYPMYEAPLLSTEQEFHLFRKYNFLKYKARQIIESLSDNTRSVKKLTLAEEYLKQASNVAKDIACANFRLTSNFLKINSVVGDAQDVISESYLDIFRSVDYFNWTKGFKFSTYATWVIRKNYSRSQQVRGVYSQRFPNGFGDNVFDSVIEERLDIEKEKMRIKDYKTKASKILAFLKRQNLRYYDVVSQRFGPKKKTLEQIGSDLNVTKECVRQIYMKAVKLVREKFGNDYLEKV